MIEYRTEGWQNIRQEVGRMLDSWTGEYDGQDDDRILDWRTEDKELNRRTTKHWAIARIDQEVLIMKTSLHLLKTT